MSKQEIQQEKEHRRMDWHLFWTAATVIVALGGMMIGGYVNMVSRISDLKSGLSREIYELRGEVVKIQTILILKGLAPAEMFSSEGDKK